ncbi:RNA polymerase recycling motor HelD [Ligilactobacillus sp. Marseille-Q7487]|uniref:RNA polymerase recycling motor HelD n=1 Tax=Ligilactobacillus sp. Marseille-Q7487 TaxID=3022128 RepID=UPI0024A88D3F|nr:RNA polymerase recycling motor HelD [Ligilactobacillus sp. Marseille-Q7487]
MDQERKKEQKRVTYVCQLIKQRTQKLKDDLAKAQQETALVERNYSQNAKINTFEIDDQMETNAEVQQQKQLVAKNLQDQKILKHQLKQLGTLQNSPYFGRIDIQEDNTESETLYIGTASFVDQNQDFLIYDWRAPICALYYNGTLGQVSYTTPAGLQKAQLLKKRQFTIVNGQIKHMFDTNETIGDEILQSVLSEHSDEYMKNIVATIQKEQNDIIRDTRNDLLLVQGVAGSGKTSAILQRIAFLLYHNREKLAVDQIILFSPNYLFSHYISEVLPSLGEKNMRQLTLNAFLKRRFEGLKVEELFERYEQNQASFMTKIKESAYFMQQISAYVTSLDPADICFSDILLDGEIFFSKTQIARYYQNLPATLKPAARFLETKNLLIKELNKRIRTQTRLPWVLEQIEMLNERQYHALMQNKERGRFQEIADEQDYLARQILKKRYAKVYEALYNDYFIDTYAQYEHFLNTTLPKATRQFTLNLEYHRIELADCAPLLYLRDLLTGSGQNMAIAHLFIDEMQDYSLAMLLYLKHAFPKAKLTLLGDSEQALFNPLQTPDKLLNSLQQTLDVKKSKLIALNRSYRSTYEITNFAKQLLPDGDNIEAFNRPGTLPKLILVPDLDIGLATLKQQVALLNGQIALITKDAKQAFFLASKLDGLGFKLVKKEDQKLPQQNVILPIYLAKGLEFDNVLAFDISQSSYTDDDIGILYTICSRAMHQLTLIGIKQFPTCFQAITPTSYQLEKHLQLKHK